MNVRCVNFLLLVYVSYADEAVKQAASTFLGDQALDHHRLRKSSPSSQVQLASHGPSDGNNELLEKYMHQCLQVEGARRTQEWSVTIPTEKNGDLEVAYADPGLQNSQEDITLFRDYRKYIAGRVAVTKIRRAEEMKNMNDAWGTYDKLFLSNFGDRAPNVRTLELGLGLGSGVFRLADAGVPHENIHVIDHEQRMFDLATQCTGSPLNKENFHIGDAVDVVQQLAQAKPPDGGGQKYDFIIFDAFEMTCHISPSVKDKLKQFSYAMVQLTSPGGMAIFNACDSSSNDKRDQWDLAKAFQTDFQHHGAECHDEQRLTDGNRLMICTMPPSSPAHSDMLPDSSKLDAGDAVGESLRDKIMMEPTAA